MATITLYSLADYVGGTLHSHTFDLYMIDSEQEWRDGIEEWLEELSEKLEDGITREEWIVADYEGIPSGFVGEYDIDPDYWEFKEALEASHLDEEIFMAGYEAGISIDQIEEAYCGVYESDEDFAYTVAEDLGALPLHTAPWPLSYIDWEAAARDLMTEHTEWNGHYFRNF